LANSTHQLRRLAEVRDGKSPSLATLPEYVFFRDRYKLGDPEETALLFLSDATIRRWCGPRWRIGTSRRTRAAAVLAEMQASQMDELAGGQVEPGPFFSCVCPCPTAPRATDAAGVVSSVHGRLDFSRHRRSGHGRGEQGGGCYERWRDGYQRNWTVGSTQCPADGREAEGSRPIERDAAHRRQPVSPVRVAVAEGQDRPDAGDPHDAPLQVAVPSTGRAECAGREQLRLVDGQRLLARLDGRLRGVLRRRRSFWDELARTTRDDRDDFFASRCTVCRWLRTSRSRTAGPDGLFGRAAGFLEQTARMTVGNAEAPGESYVCGSASEKAIDQNRESEKWTLCYSATGEA
jgi:hypothetical protein